ncbi:hypothetical protein FQN55_008835 [Onygenales sp. PD_40]|nr:hypothetical protein FQN55_008835 [Onygenales sp. PD_40]KAK2781921.1 hypothetical protein FQN53_000264 [Emmonsiellopsis sp. PD_33]KAK2794867.1 hypothetical protein FQN51_000610 [Onygenales sp. PD_10]
MFSKVSLPTLAVVLVQLSSVLGQTFSECDPTKGQKCPANPAFGKSTNFDLTKDKLPEGWSCNKEHLLSYSDDGMGISVKKQGDNPELRSNFYIMFGKVDITMKASPGQGIVSSAVLQSDCRDEIDFEWLGTKDSTVETNYFRKGNTATYDRGMTVNGPDNQKSFKTYTIDWDSNRIIWKIDGNVVRTLTAEDAIPQGGLPQTPAFIKIGTWASGDPSNTADTIKWGGGPTDYSAGPFTMMVKSISVTDYSTGSKYEYTGDSGTWKSIKAIDGEIDGSAKDVPTASTTSPPKKESTAEPSGTATATASANDNATKSETPSGTTSAGVVGSTSGASASGPKSTATDSAAPPYSNGGEDLTVRIRNFVGVACIIFSLSMTF